MLNPATKINAVSMADFLAMDFSEQRFKQYYRLRYNLPYGMWSCRDGRQVLFNRYYQPIWQRYPKQIPERAKFDEWVHWTKQQYLYDDSCLPWADKVADKAARIRVDRALSDFLASEPVMGFLP